MVISLSAKKREGESLKKIRKEDGLPVVLYGAKRKSTPLTVDKKEFNNLYKEAGESTLIELKIEGEKDSPPVLIHDVQREPIKGEIIHADFFEPNLKEEVEAEIPLVFIGESPAVKDKEGTLVKNLYSLDVKALPQNLPHEIKVDISSLVDFDDVIYVKNLEVPSDVQIIQEPDWSVAMVSAPENVEEELEKPIEEGETEVVGEKEKAEKAEEEEKKETTEEIKEE